MSSKKEQPSSQSSSSSRKRNPSATVVEIEEDPSDSSNSSGSSSSSGSSRSTSNNNPVEELDGSGGKERNNKEKSDSGFHEEDYSNPPSPSTTGGGKRHHHHTRRRLPTAPPLPSLPPPLHHNHQHHHHHPQSSSSGTQREHHRRDDGDEGDVISDLPFTGTAAAAHRPSDASLLSRFSSSDLPEYNLFEYPPSQTSASSVYSISLAEPQPGALNSSGSNSGQQHQQQAHHPPTRKGKRGLGKKAPAPLTPPPTSVGLLQGEKSPGNTAAEYEFPSDTELSEIIAIMSGIASPRKLGNKSLHKMNSLQRHEEEDEEGIHTFEEEYDEEDNNTNAPLPHQRVSNLRRGESLNVYEKNKGPASSSMMMNGVGPGSPVLSNGNIPNGTVNRRYLPKQGKSLDMVSMTGSYHEGLNDLNRSKNHHNTSVNSLNDILKASKAGTLPMSKNSKKKTKKKKPPPPPSRRDDEDPAEVEFYRKNRISWKQRLKLSLTIVVSVILILASSSLLFIVPIIVDPILVGLEAKFSSAPAQCRTVSKRSGKGAFDCTIPSCREGCTADLMFCYFIEVEYRIGVYNTSAKSLFNNNYLSYNHAELQPSSTAAAPPSSPSSLSEDAEDGGSNNNNNNNDSVIVYDPSTATYASPVLVQPPPNVSYQLDSSRVDSQVVPASREGILLVNPNGCGYPDKINCTEFEKKFGEIGYTFPCYYSSENMSIVVPFYSRTEEILTLSVWLIIPCGVSVVLSGVLYLLLKWKPKPKQYKPKKKKKAKLEDPPPSKEPNYKITQNGKLNLDPHATSNGVPLPQTSKLGNLMGDLTGITAKNIMKSHNYSKFHASMSNPPSAINSRQGSVHRGDSLEVELDRLEHQAAASSSSKKESNQSTASLNSGGPPHLLHPSSSSASRPGQMTPEPASSPAPNRTHHPGSSNPENYNFNHNTPSSKFNEKDLGSGGSPYLSNGHLPSGTGGARGPSTTSITPKRSAVALKSESAISHISNSSNWQLSNSSGVLHHRNNNNHSQPEEDPNSNSSPFHTKLQQPSSSSTSRSGGAPLGALIKGRNSIDSVDSLDSAKTISFGKL